MYIRSGIEFRFRWSIAYTPGHSNSVVRVSLEDLSLFTVIRFGYSLELFPRAARRDGRRGKKEKRARKKGGRGGSEKLFDQVSVDGKLNQIGLDKAGRKSVVYKPRALLPSNSFPIFFFFFFSSLSVYLVLNYFDDYSFQYFFHFDGKIKMKIVREGVNWENC